MPDYLTRDQIQDIRKSESSTDLKSLVDRARQRRPAGMTFLSHSSKDDDLIPVIVAILERNGASVYLDTDDPTLSSDSGREIAIQLRSRIRASRKFIVFVTENSKQSKWVPWELGMSDGCKHPRNTAVFPSVDNAFQTSWVRQEYLEAYDRIVWGKMVGLSESTWLVWNEDENTACTLREWLTRA